MKNPVFCFILFLSFFVLFACGSKPPAPEAPPPPASAAPPPAPPTEPPKAATPSRTTDLILDGCEIYTVVRGDTLSKISERKYQNDFYYPLIMMASKDIVKDQDFILPGMVLTIPKLKVNLDDPRARESMKKYFLEIADIVDRKKLYSSEGLRKLIRESL